MKKVLICVMSLMMLFALSPAAFADILWSPADNSFFDTHYRSCEYLGRSYYANGGEGFVTTWDAPEGSVVKEQYQNGEVLWVGYTYQGWGLVSRWDDGEEVSGWVPMSDLYLVYDHISFEEEFGSEFQEYNGEFAGYGGEAGELFQFWEYPNAGEPNMTLEIRQEMLDALRGTGTDQSYISKVYVDDSGQTWGFVNYMYGIRNFWLLLDNPTGDGIMTSCVPEADDLIASGELVPPQEPVPPKLGAMGWLPYGITAVVAAAAAGVIAIIYGKKKNR